LFDIEFIAMLRLAKYFSLTLLASVSLWSQTESQAKSETAKDSTTSTSSSPGFSDSSTPKQGDSTKLEILKTEKAIFPAEAAEKGIQARVLMRVTVSETGDVENVEVISGEPILVRPAVDAIKKWKFKPFIKNGVAIKVHTKVPLDFAFTDKVFDQDSFASKPATTDSSSAAGSSAQLGADASGGPPSTNANLPTRVRISQGVSQMFLIHQVAPVYPTVARSNHIEGTVLLRAEISKDGAIEDLQLISGPKELVQAAIGAVAQWRYRPYLLKGQPIAVETQIMVNFKLH
jgi:TonB family protein